VKTSMASSRNSQLPGDQLRWLWSKGIASGVSSAGPELARFGMLESVRTVHSWIRFNSDWLVKDPPLNRNFLLEVADHHSSRRDFLLLDQIQLVVKLHRSTTIKGAIASEAAMPRSGHSPNREDDDDYARTGNWQITSSQARMRRW
jgi:hypothetical protein